MKNQSQRVSCLMVTLPVSSRLAFAKRSIQAYCDQTYPERELLVMVEGGEPAVRDELLRHIAALDRADIRVFCSAEARSLGELRNWSIEAATGDVMCQWDDDDLYHPQRLAAQLASLVEGDHEAVYLQEVMQFYPGAGKMFLTNWRATAAGGHPGTLMARLPLPVRYPTRGEQASRGEDLSVALQMIARGRVGYLQQQPCLFLYVSHGSNTWDLTHHTMLSSELAVSQGLLRRREQSLRAGLAPFRFPADSIDISGPNGVAFRL